MPREREMTEIEDVEIIAETALALLCRIGENEEWIPKSQIGEDSGVGAVGDVGTLQVAEWLAIERGLV